MFAFFSCLERLLIISNSQSMQAVLVCNLFSA